MHLDIFKGAPLRLPKPLSDQFPVRVCLCVCAHFPFVYKSSVTSDREDASSLVTAGATANTMKGNSRASRGLGLLCSHSHAESIAGCVQW